MIDSLRKSMEEEEVIFEAMQSLVDGETADIELLGGLPNSGTNWKSLRKVRCLMIAALLPLTFLSCRSTN